MREHKPRGRARAYVLANFNGNHRMRLSNQSEAGPSREDC